MARGGCVVFNTPFAANSLLTFIFERDKFRMQYSFATPCAISTHLALPFIEAVANKKSGSKQHYTIRELQQFFTEKERARREAEAADND